jgi:heavy metal sensor kinase
MGAKWTLRYSVAILVTLAVYSIYAYTRIQQQASHDGRLLLALQAAELAGQIEQTSASIENSVDFISHVSEMDPHLKISVQVFDLAGHARYASGVLAEREIGIPPEFTTESEDSLFYEVDLGQEHKYWVLVVRAGGNIIQVGTYSREFVRPVRQLRMVLLTTVPTAFLITVVLGWWLARTSLRPLTEITATAARISGSRLDAGIPLTGSGDELDQLAQTLNDMTGRIGESVAKLRHFSVDAAHQLRTPLTALRSRLEVTLETESMTAELRRVLTDTLSEIDQLAEAVTSMLQLASSEAGLEPGLGVPVSLGPVLDSVIDFYGPSAAEQGLSLHRRGASDATVSGDISWLRQLFGNLVENACRHTPSGGRIDVEIERSEETVLVRVRDTGPGMKEEDLERVFDRFFRVPSPGAASGVGLGLTVAYQIARAHGGEIRAESTVGRGSTFTVSLPSISDSEHRQGAGARSSPTRFSG